jgi:hypothetical protein
MLLMPSEVQTQAQNNFFSLAKKERKEAIQQRKKERDREGGRGRGASNRPKKKRKRKGKRIQDHLLLCLSCTGPNSLLSLPGAPVRWRGPRRRLVCLSVGGCASKSDLSLCVHVCLCLTWSRLHKTLQLLFPFPSLLLPTQQVRKKFMTLQNHQTILVQIFLFSFGFGSSFSSFFSPPFFFFLW